MKEKTIPDKAVVKFSHCCGAMLEMFRACSDAAEMLWGETHVPALFFTRMEDCRKLSSSMAVFVVNLHVDERCVSGTWSGKRPLIGKNATQQGSWTKHGMSDQDASQVSWRSHFESLSSVGIETNHSHRYRKEVSVELCMPEPILYAYEEEDRCAETSASLACLTLGGFQHRSMLLTPWHSLARGCWTVWCPPRQGSHRGATVRIGPAQASTLAPAHPGTSPQCARAQSSGHPVSQ